MLNNNNKKSLKDMAIELNSGCPLMLDRDKGDLDKLIGTVVTIIDFDFMTDSEKGKEYVVFIITEDDAMFYFGGTVLTDKMLKFEQAGYTEEIKKNGLPVLFGKKESKDRLKQPYTTAEFYPEEEQKPAKSKEK